jgi:hypothetical protein
MHISTTKQQDDKFGVTVSKTYIKVPFPLVMPSDVRSGRALNRVIYRQKCCEHGLP